MKRQMIDYGVLADGRLYSIYRIYVRYVLFIDDQFVVSGDTLPEIYAELRERES